MTTTNADPQELEKFGELAHKWWDTEGDFKPLHRINPLRLDWIAQRAPLRGKAVLDVGCGGGILAEAMARRGANVLGIDLSVKPLKVARLHAMESGVAHLEYREVAVEALAAERPASFDAVTCMEMLEHVPDPGSIVASCAALVKPGGPRLFFSTLNRNAKSFLFAIVERRARAQDPAQGHARIREKFITPERARRASRAPRASRCSELVGHGIQPADEALLAVGRARPSNYLVACRRPA